jgi:hypothetical protein
MTVYVDDWQQQARVGRLNARWSHLSSGPFDDFAELHAFARRIGMRKAWFQDKPWPWQHYDVTEPKRQQAIAAGAVAITWREGGRQRQAAVAAHRAIRGAAESDPPGWVAPFGAPVSYLHRVDPAADPSLGSSESAHGSTVCGRPLLVSEVWIPAERRDGDNLCAACCFPQARRPTAPEVIEEAMF